MAYEGDVVTRKPQNRNGAWYLGLEPEMREYLELDDDHELIIKFDKGKHGKFLGIGKKE